MEENRLAVCECCAQRRFLFVFEHLNPRDEEFVCFGGKASALVIKAAEPPDPRSLEETLSLFSSWFRAPDVCLAALGDVQFHLCSPQIVADSLWPTACSLASAAVALLKSYTRLAEAHELLEWMANALSARGDLAGGLQTEWETSWILEEWGQPLRVPSRVAIQIVKPAQLELPF